MGWRPPRKRKRSTGAAPVTPPLPAGPTADSYRLVGYTPGLVGSSPECIVIAPRYDSGIRWADPNNPSPEDVLWGGGVRAGVPWDGTFYRDLSRYAAGGQFFWCSYFKPGSAPGLNQGFWMNFGKGWSHLHNDDPAQILGGASQRLFWESPHRSPGSPPLPQGERPDAERPGEGQWKLVIEATQYVTHTVINVWTGTKAASPGNDPIGQYTRVAGCDPLASLAIEGV